MEGEEEELPVDMAWRQCGTAMVWPTGPAKAGIKTTYPFANRQQSVVHIPSPNQSRYVEIDSIKQIRHPQMSLEDRYQPFYDHHRRQRCPLKRFHNIGASDHEHISTSRQKHSSNIEMLLLNSSAANNTTSPNITPAPEDYSTLSTYRKQYLRL